MADINIKEVYEELKYIDAPETSRLIKDYLALRDSEIGKLREYLREAVEWSCGNPDDNCGDCVAHGGDTPCKCEKWRKALGGGAK